MSFAGFKGAVGKAVLALMLMTGGLATATPSFAGCSSSSLTTLTNGTTADAIAVMANFNYLAGCSGWTEASIAASQPVAASNSGTFYVATSALTLTVAQTTTLSTTFSLAVSAQGGAVTITPNASDGINGGTLGASVVVAKGFTASVVTDAAGNLYVMIQPTSSVIAATSTPNAIVQANGSGVIDPSFYSGGGTAFKNLLIGGDFTTNPWQRGTSFSSVANNTYTADRFEFNYGTVGSGAFNIAQVADAPTQAQAGTTAINSLKVTVGAAATSTGAGTYAYITQPIEAVNFGQLGFGASGAQSATLSFWVKSSVTGTYSAVLQNYAQTASYPVNFTIPTANTWQKIVATITGDTAGTWVAGTNAGAAYLSIVLHAGSTYQSTNATWNNNTTNGGNTLGTSSNSNGLIGTLSATFQLAIVQLEAGSTATSFENLPVDIVTERCKRYFQTIGMGLNGQWKSTTDFEGSATFAPTMRSSPTVSLSHNITAQLVAYGSGVVGVSSVALNAVTRNGGYIVCTTSATSAGDTGGGYSGDFIYASAEL